MRTVLICLFVVTLGASSVVAGPCSGAKTQLAQISGQLKLGSLDGVKSALELLSRAYPACLEVLLQQARLAQAEGNLDAAADLYYRYTDGNPNDSKGLAYFGRFFLEQRDYVRADALSAAAVQKNAVDPVALSLRAQILVMKGQPHEAQELLEKAIQIDPDEPEAQFQLGEIYDKAKLSPKAVSYFQKVVALN